MAVLYIDQVFALNFVVDYLLLLMTARLMGMPLQRLRFSCAAACGALYSVAACLPHCQFLMNPLLRLAGGLLMALMAYWQLQHRWRIVWLFFMLSAALGGIVLALGLVSGSGTAVVGKLYYANVNWLILFVSALGMYILLHLIFGQGARHGGGELMRISVRIHGRETELLALYDTGNTLRDPVSGQPVLVTEQAALCDIWEDDLARIIAEPKPPEEKIAVLHSCGLGLGFALLPYRCVGTSCGLLLAVRSDRLKIGDAIYPRAWVAMTEGPVSDGGTYQALWGGTKRGEKFVEITQQTVCVDSQTQQAG